MSSTSEDQNPKRDQLADYVKKVRDSDLDLKRQGVVGIRKLLSIASNPPINEVLASGILPDLVDLLSLTDVPDVQFESAWALTNVASGTSDQTDQLVQAGAVPIFISLLDTPNKELQDQLIWALGNIAGDCSRLRDLVLSYPSVIDHFNRFVHSSTSTVSFLRTLVWFIQNCYRSKPPPPYHKIASSIPALLLVINRETDHEILCDSTWALHHLLQRDELDSIDSILSQLYNQEGIIDRLVHLLTTPPRIASVLVGVITALLPADYYRERRFFKASALPALVRVATNNPPVNQRKGCAAFCQLFLSAGSTDLVRVLVEADFLRPLMQLFPSASPETRKQVLQVCINLRERDHIYLLVKLNILEGLLWNDSVNTELQIQCLDHLLTAGRIKPQLKCISHDILNHSRPSTTEYHQLCESCMLMDRTEEQQKHFDLSPETKVFLQTFLRKQFQVADTEYLPSNEPYLRVYRYMEPTHIRSYLSRVKISNDIPDLSSLTISNQPISSSSLWDRLSDALEITWSYLSDSDVMAGMTASHSSLKYYSSYPVKMRWTSDYVEVYAPLLSRKQRPLRIIRYQGVFLPLLYIPTLTDIEITQNTKLPLLSLFERDLTKFKRNKNDFESGTDEPFLPSLRSLLGPFFKAKFLRGSLTYLDFSDKFNEPFETAFPFGLTILKLGEAFNQPLPPNILPSSLTQLFISTDFDQPLLVDSLPPSLTELVFVCNSKFEKVLEPHILPSSLLSLTLGNIYDHPFSIGVLPNSLQILELGWSYNQPFLPNQLPSSITHLTLNHDYNQKFAASVLPSSLTTLQTGFAYAQPFDIGVLPPSLLHLDLSDSRHYSNLKSFNPAALPHPDVKITYYSFLPITPLIENMDKAKRTNQIENEEDEEEN